MWRGPTVAGQKEASAKIKGKVFTIHSKLIALAAERGSDPTINTLLADAIADAKRAGVTTDVIDRAVKRGAGLDKDSQKVEEIFYEGYAPGGVAVIVRALTDNHNRTAPNMRHIFSAFWGNLGETGSVSNFLFDYLGKICIETPEDIEAFELELLGIGGESTKIITNKSHLVPVKSALQEAGYTIVESQLTYEAKNYIEVTEFEIALKIYKMLEAFHEDEDVEWIWNNADISDELWKEVEAFIESKKFRT
jgi:YebC/PmpR family DNA-binding regulatory protein